MKFRKKPVEIEAMQWDGTAEGATLVIDWVLAHPDVHATPSYYAPGEWDGGETHGTYLNIPTLEGQMLASPEDWIIIGSQNELYPCRPGIFGEVYEEVDESFIFDPLTHELYQAAEQVREVNEANGWFEAERSVGEDIALLHSEASEMLEAYREHGLDDATDQIHVIDGAQVHMPKPEGFGSEAADVLIRLLDTCTRRGVNLGWEFRRKLAYNATRGHRHGGKRL